MEIICYFSIGGLKMENIENVAGIFLPTKAETEKKKTPSDKREEGGGGQTPHEMKQNYS